jgi:hypothetical protein
MPPRTGMASLRPSEASPAAPKPYSRPAHSLCVSRSVTNQRSVPAVRSCTCIGRVMRGARLYRRPRVRALIATGPDQTGLPLSDEQRGELEWRVDAPEPGGG